MGSANCFYKFSKLDTVFVFTSTAAARHIAHGKRAVADSVGVGVGVPVPVPLSSGPARWPCAKAPFARAGGTSLRHRGDGPSRNILDNFEPARSFECNGSAVLGCSRRMQPFRFVSQVAASIHPMAATRKRRRFKTPRKVGVRSRTAQAAAARILTGCDGDIQLSKFQIRGANALVLKVELIVRDTARGHRTGCDHVQGAAILDALLSRSSCYGEHDERQFPVEMHISYKTKSWPRRLRAMRV